MKESYKERHCRLSVSKKSSGRRLDSYLSARFMKYSRSFFQKLIADGKVHMKGRRVKNSSIIAHGVDIVLTLPEIKSPVLAQDIELDILFEDKWMVAINKEANHVVHPARGNWKGTVLNALFGRHREKVDEIDGFYPKVAHRLDKNTSGVLLCGYYEKEEAILAQQFEARTVRKIYSAIVHGVIEPDNGEIDLPIAFNPRTDRYVRIDEAEGKPSRTIFRVLKRYPKYTYVQLELLTGRTHQIRIHMSSMGHPVVCDDGYGDGEAIFPQDILGHDYEALEPVIDRQALHSQVIEFDHPVSGERIRVEAPLKKDMREFLELLDRQQG